MQITATVEEPLSFVINLAYWDLSPKKPDHKGWSEYVYTFAGTKRVEELGAVPFDLFPNAENIQTELQKRGQKIRDIPSGGLKWFKGFVNVPVHTYGGSRRRWIEGRVIIDPDEYDKVVTKPYEFTVEPPLPLFPGGGNNDVSKAIDEVDDDQLAQARSVVRGFSLDSKSWHEFEVDNISDIEWNDQVRKQPRS